MGPLEVLSVGDARLLLQGEYNQTTWIKEERIEEEIRL